MSLKNDFGRPLDELDILKMRVYAQSKTSGSYSFSSSDGKAICGFVSNNGGEVAKFVSLEFKG